MLLAVQALSHIEMTRRDAQERQAQAARKLVTRRPRGRSLTDCIDEIIAAHQEAEIALRATYGYEGVKVADRILKGNTGRF
jgi:hypothetical protein